MPRAKQKSAGGGRRQKVAPPRPAPDSDVAIAVADETTIVEPHLDDVPVAHISTALMLPDCLDSEAAITIKEMLLAQRGNAVAVDASQVRRVGVQSLQILVAAARAWQRDGLSYRLENPSPEFLETIALVGLPRQDLLLEGHQ